ncbi:MAG: glycosyltransferase family 2 protein [Candidatus Moranbacteria bacterium]|jgi:dolichol-phosphate mannosyltransferase|nr:glycosyltransferase family 2 protein [Candidatus Moranbacteria bacterium]
MKLISIIIPTYNEEKNVPLVYAELKKIFQKLSDRYAFEIIFINDGSVDDTAGEIEKLASVDPVVKFIDFSRNFGKEMATTAGINNCNGDACIMVDADLQHPIELFPEFIARWENGAEVVIGVRKASKSDSMCKKLGGRIFYKIIKLISDVPVIPQATDYRLLDRIVIDAFNDLPEHNRMTRGLIDWLGFKREVLLFEANERVEGEASYSTFKLCQLAFTSIISLSMLPLRIAGYMGIFIVFAAGTLGVIMFVDRYIVDWGMNFSGTAILANITLFLIGGVLISIGLLAFYIGHIHSEAINRPIYIVRNKK